MGLSLKLRPGVASKTLDGLKALDGIPSAKGIVRFDFSNNPQLVYAIAKDSVIFERELEPFNRAKSKLAVTHCVADGMAITPANAAQVAAFYEGVSALEDGPEIELSGLIGLKLDELQKGRDIPPGVIKNLLPLIPE